MFKSSGLIVSTGVGSSGWLYSARQMPSLKIQSLMEVLGSQYQSNERNEETADDLSAQTLFGHDEKRMFFFVREGFSLTQMTEGFCEDLQVTSEMINGEVIIDGWQQHNLSLGDKFSLTVPGEDKALKSLRLNVE